MADTSLQGCIYGESRQPIPGLAPVYDFKLEPLEKLGMARTANARPEASTERPRSVLRRQPRIDNDMAPLEPDVLTDGEVLE